ncbi:unnamed protein product, partial [Prunus brigantina]
MLEKPKSQPSESTRHPLSLLSLSLSLSLKISEKGRRPGFFHLHEKASPRPPLPNPPHHRPGTPPQKAAERSKTGGVAPPLPPLSRLFLGNFGHLCRRSFLQK